MRIVRPSTEAEMIASFLRGELGSTRFDSAVDVALGELGADERLVLEPNLDDEHENALRRAALAAARGYPREGLFDGFPPDVSWEVAALTPDEILEIRYIDYSYWIELSGGSRRPVDAAERIRRGVTAFGVANDGFLEAARALAAALPPPLIVVGGAGNRRVVVEGHVRLTAFALEPDALPAELEVLLGHSPRIGKWALW